MTDEKRQLQKLELKKDMGKLVAGTQFCAHSPVGPESRTLCVYHIVDTSRLRCVVCGDADGG